MSEGQQAAENVKGGIQQAGDFTEGIRKNINSFADNLLNPGAKDANHQGATAGASGDVHPDAKVAGGEIEKGLNSLSAKLGAGSNQK